MKNKIVQKEIISNILTLFTGSGASQAIPILASPLLARLYSPEEYGKLAIYTSLVMLVSSVATGQYDIAIMLPDSEKDTVNLVLISITFTLLISFFTFLVIIVIKTNFFQINFFIPNYFIYLIPLHITITSLIRILGYWLNRYKKYNDLAFIRSLQALSSTTLNISLGYLGFASKGLIISFFLSQLISLFYSILKSKNLLSFSHFLSLRNIFWNIKKYKNFLVFNTPQVLLDTIANNTSVFCIKQYFGEAALGLYSFSQKITNIPFSLVSLPFSQVFYQECSQKYKNQEGVWELTKLFLFPLIALLPLVIILMIYAPQVFSVIFGTQWIKSGLYVRIILPWIFANFLSSCISTIPLILNRQKEFFFIGAIYNIILISLFYFMPPFFQSLQLTLILVSSFASIYHVCIILWFRKVALVSS